MKEAMEGNERYHNAAYAYMNTAPLIVLSFLSRQTCYTFDQYFFTFE